MLGGGSAGVANTKPKYTLDASGTCTAIISFLISCKGSAMSFEFATEISAKE